MVRLFKLKPFRKFLKWFFIIFSVLLVGGGIFVTFFLEDILVNKLKRELRYTFRKYYSIDYKSMTTRMDWNGLSITIDEPVF